MRLTDKMKDDERHIIQRILRGETTLYEHFLNLTKNPSRDFTVAQSKAQECIFSK